MKDLKLITIPNTPTAVNPELNDIMFTSVTTITGSADISTAIGALIEGKVLDITVNGVRSVPPIVFTNVLSAFDIITQINSNYVSTIAGIGANNTLVLFAQSIKINPGSSNALLGLVNYKTEVITSTNDVATVESTERKTQDIMKILMTSIGSIPAYPVYGSNLPNIAGQRNTDAVFSQISTSVISALSFLNAVETSAELSEQIGAIVSLQVSSGADAREILLNLVVNMRDGSTATVTMPTAM